MAQPHSLLTEYIGDDVGIVAVSKVTEVWLGMEDLVQGEGEASHRDPLSISADARDVATRPKSDLHWHPL